MTHGVVADADGGGDVGKGPEAAFGVVDALFLEILEFLVLLMVSDTRTDYSHRMRPSSPGSIAQSSLRAP